jgi:hypothetical protein
MSSSPAYSAWTRCHQPLAPPALLATQCPHAVATCSTILRHVQATSSLHPPPSRSLSPLASSTPRQHHLGTAEQAMPRSATAERLVGLPHPHRNLHASLLVPGRATTLTRVPVLAQLATARMAHLPIRLLLVLAHGRFQFKISFFQFLYLVQTAAAFQNS